MSNFSFNREQGQFINPKISVICINKNGEKYIEDTILSVFQQNYDDYEFIISDGGSTDRSLEIIGKYKFIKLLPGKDSSRIEGLLRAVEAARGQYLMVTTSTDGYLSRDWFKSASLVMDNDPQVSLVFGASACMSSEGALGSMVYPRFFSFNNVPLKEKWTVMWLKHGLNMSYFPELNYCVKMDIFRKLIGPSIQFPELNEIDPILRFHFEFNRHGYLPKYLSTLANFGRTHNNQEQLSERHRFYVIIYNEVWKKYRKGVISGQYTHFLRDSQGKKIDNIKYTVFQRLQLILPRIPSIFSILRRGLNKI
jgi:glycosyltransferase involved in cell wall biosynthesis